MPVGQDPQYRKKLGPSLHLIDDHQTLKVAKRYQRLLKPCKAQRVFKIEVVQGVGRDELSGKRRLPALARTQKGDDPAAAEGGSNVFDKGGAWDHGEILH